MSQWLRDFLALSRKANPIGALNVQDTNDDAQPHPFDYEAHLKAYAINVYVFGAIRAIAADVSATPILIQRRIRLDGEFTWVTQDDTNATAKEIWKLFTRPNVDETWNQLSERWVISKQATGNSYLVYDSEKGGEFWYIKPDWVKVTTDAIGRPTGYQVENNGVKKLITLENIIHLKSANPSGEWYGMPPSEVIKKTIMTKLSLNTYLHSYFKNAGLLGLVVSGSDLDLASESHRKIIKKELKALYSGADKAGMTAVFGGDVEAKLMSHSLKDMVPETLDELVRREVCVAYRVPPIKLTILDEATYNNAREQDKIYQRGTVEPERCLIEDTINLQFIWPRFGDDWRFHYDRSEILGLQEDRGEKSIYVLREYSGGLIDKNTAREQLGYDPLEDGGEEFVTLPQPISLVASGGGDGKALTPLAGDSVETSLKDERRELQRKQLSAQWEKRQAKMKKHIRRFFFEQLDRLLVKIDQVTGKGKHMHLLPLYVKGDIPEAMINDLFAILEEDELLALFMAEILEELAEDAGQQALTNAGVDLAFNVQDPRVQAIIETMANNMKDINQTTWQSVRRLIGDSHEAGESLERLSERLTKKFNQFSKGRAEVIARTETNKISNGSSFEAFQQGGIEDKEWLSVRDGHVRNLHIQADGEIVGLNEPFIRTGEPLMYPSDPSGRPGNVINCRCQVVVPQVEGDFDE